MAEKIELLSDCRHALMKTLFQAQAPMTGADLCVKERHRLCQLRKLGLVKRLDGGGSIARSLPIVLTERGELYCRRFFKGDDFLVYYPERQQAGVAAVSRHAFPTEKLNLQALGLTASPVRPGAMDAFAINSLPMYQWKKGDTV